MLRRWGPLAAVVGIQLAILVAIPFRRLEARLRGTEITLRTVPVDPYDLLAGYYVTLAYEVERTAPAVPWPGDPAWLLVRRGAPAWSAAECCLAAKPESLPADVVAIRVRTAQDRFFAGGRSCEIPSAGRFYIPEARREEVAEALRKAGGRALVDLRVDDDGNAALVRLRVGDLVLAD